MNYQNIQKATFIDRPNRFIAIVEIDGKREVCHVKNTGRLKELLLPDATVWVEFCPQPTRKTKFDLIAVQKGDQIINIDSQAPNKIAAEWIKTSGLFHPESTLKTEVKCGDSRFDLWIEDTFIEVKGVTLNQEGVARFPDAPTLRGVKHLNELAKIAENGGKAMILFVVQMKGIHHVEPNDQTHPEFGEALRAAAKAGVKILAVDCKVTPDEIIADQILPVYL
ncbi:MAG: DNA/RNA nuclease SfsA [Clostridia bacterium]|nr:DNA/RNA nuclease SfsA [Clostridia bacterium]